MAKAQTRPSGRGGRRSIVDPRRNPSRTPPNIRGRASISAVSALRQKKSTPSPAGPGPGGARGGRGREAVGEGPRRRPGSRQQAAGFTPACSRGPAPPWAPGCSAEGPPRGCGGRARGGAAAARPRRRAPWSGSLPEDGEGGRREGRGRPSSRPPPPPGAPRWRSCAAGGSGGPATTERGSGGLTDDPPGSGPEAGAALGALLGGADLPTPRRLSTRRLRDPATGEVLDAGMVVWFPGPRSFTGEDGGSLACARTPSEGVRLTEQQSVRAPPPRLARGDD